MITIVILLYDLNFNKMHNFNFIEINQIIKGMPAPWI